MVNSFVAKKDLDSEMTVVRNEFERGENDPSSVLEERIMSTAYLWHNYGKSTIGARADIENVPIERLQAFYRQYYQPDNAVLVVAGKFDEAEDAGDWSTITSAPFPSRRGRCRRPTRSNPRRTANAKSRCAASAMCRWWARRITYPMARMPTLRRWTFVSEVLGDEPSGRLYKALVETKQAAERFQLCLSIA